MSLAGWVPGDDPDLRDQEFAAFYHLLSGDVAALLEFLDMGNIPSAELCREIASAIRAGQIVGVPSAAPALSEFARKKEGRDQWLGAWLWARRICVKGETLESAIAEAKAKGVGISDATMRRASADFIDRVMGKDFDRRLYATVSLRVCVCDFSEKLGLDRDEMLSRIEPWQKVQAIFATAK